jgi:hypothetical protein
MRRAIAQVLAARPVAGPVSPSVESALLALAEAWEATPAGEKQFFGISTNGSTFHWHNYLAGTCGRLAWRLAPAEYARVTLALLERMGQLRPSCFRGTAVRTAPLEPLLRKPAGKQVVRPMPGKTKRTHA